MGKIARIAKNGACKLRISRRRGQTFPAPSRRATRQSRLPDPRIPGRRELEHPGRAPVALRSFRILPDRFRGRHATRRAPRRDARVSAGAARVHACLSISPSVRGIHGVRGPSTTHRYRAQWRDVPRLPQLIECGVGELATVRGRRPVVGDRSAADRRSKFDLRGKRYWWENVLRSTGAPMKRPAFSKRHS